MGLVSRHLDETLFRIFMMVQVYGLNGYSLDLEALVIPFLETLRKLMVKASSRRELSTLTRTIEKLFLSSLNA